MILAVDIGNTSITFGVFRGEKITNHWHLKTRAYKTANGYYLILRDLFKQAQIKKGEIKDIIICSVVPKNLKILKEALIKLFWLKPTIVGEDINVPIKNLYHHPQQVGQDRLVNAFAGIKIYGKPLIIVDFGTAITFDILSKKGEYLGGIIVPGAEISLEALSKRAALLPQIELLKPISLIGQDTVNSMRSGIFYGFACLCDGIITRLREEIGTKTKTLATGGYARLIVDFCHNIQAIDSKLTLKGLFLLQKKKKMSKKWQK